MESIKNHYGVLGLDFDTDHLLSDDELASKVRVAYYSINGDIDLALANGEITREEADTRKQEVQDAYDVLVDSAARREYDVRLAAALAAPAEGLEGEGERRVRVTGSESDEETANKGRHTLRNVGLTVLIAALLFAAYHLGKNNSKNNDSNALRGPVIGVETTATPEVTVAPEATATLAAAEVTVEPTEEVTAEPTEEPTAEPTEEPTAEPTEEPTAEPTEEPTAEPTEEPTAEPTAEVTVAPTNTPKVTPAPTAEPTLAPVEDARVVADLGDIYDDRLVYDRAIVMVNELNAAGIVSPITTVPYTVEEVYALIKYGNGVYTPVNKEEIDVLHLNLLNILISPINNPDYTTHIIYVNGADGFEADAVEASKNIAKKPIRFDEAFCAYGQNGVYPLVKWITDKRIEIFTTTDPVRIKAIYREVGQVMADIMKGDGGTITIIENGKEVTYTITSEQLLANHSSGMVVTTEAQMIFANAWRRTNELGEPVDVVDQEWKVYSRFLPEGTYDVVSYDEINAWINPGCEEEMGISEVLPGGFTFGQMLQATLEGMAENNLKMALGPSLSK